MLAVNWPLPRPGKGNELGMKTVWMGGRISSDFGWFNVDSLTSTICSLPQASSPVFGGSYDVIVGASIEEGVDGDLSMAILPGWQLVATFYAGHDRTYVNNPISGTYDNSWSFFNRYDFPKESSLKGLALNFGISRIGGRWTSSGGIVAFPSMETTFTQQHGGLIGEAEYPRQCLRLLSINEAFPVMIRCDNVLNQAYPEGAQEAEIIDPSPPATASFLAEYKF